MIAKPFAYLSAALFIVIIIMGWFLNSYSNEIRELTLNYAYSTANEATCKKALAEQNAEIEKLRHKKPETKIITNIEYREKLKIVYKDRNVTKEECNEIVSTIDAIRKHYD